VLWAWVLFGLGYFLSFPLKKKEHRAIIGMVVTVVFFLLPIIDEIKGWQEFESLCNVGNKYQISPKAEGKKFDLKFAVTPEKELKGYSRPVLEETITYTDLATGEVMATAKAYSARGGWLVRHGFGLTSQSAPLLGPGRCAPYQNPRNKESYNRFLSIKNKEVN
jgi:hypothetical protein